MIVVRIVDGSAAGSVRPTGSAAPRGKLTPIAHRIIALGDAAGLIHP